MAIEPKDYRIMVRVSNHGRDLLQKEAEREKTSLAEIARRSIQYYLDDTDRFDFYRDRAENVDKQNEMLISSNLSLLHSAEVSRTNFNTCVIILMKVLNGEVTEGDKRAIAAQFAPYAEIARREIKELQDAKVEMRSAAEELKKVLSDDCKVVIKGE
jgi:hypothetical protein